MLHNNSLIMSLKGDSFTLWVCVWCYFHHFRPHWAFTPSRTLATLAMHCVNTHTEHSSFSGVCALIQRCQPFQLAQVLSGCWGKKLSVLVCKEGNMSSPQREFPSEAARPPSTGSLVTRVLIIMPALPARAKFKSSHKAQKK